MMVLNQVVLSRQAPIAFKCTLTGQQGKVPLVVRHIHDARSKLSNTFQAPDGVAIASVRAKLRHQRLLPCAVPATQTGALQEGAATNAAVKAVLFDMDGVLISSEELSRR